MSIKERRQVLNVAIMIERRQVPNVAITVTTGVSHHIAITVKSAQSHHIAIMISRGRYSRHTSRQYNDRIQPTMKIRAVHETMILELNNMFLLKVVSVFMVW